MPKHFETFLKDLDLVLENACEDDSCAISDSDEFNTFYYDEETDTIYTEDEFESLDESVLLEFKRKIRVTSKGQRIRRIKCPAGRILKKVNGKLVCVVPTGTQRLTKRIAIKRANRTKKAKGANYTRRISFKRSRALRRRKAMGLKDGM